MNRLLQRAESLLGRLEALLPPAPGDFPADASVAFQWRGGNHGQRFRPVPHHHGIRLADLRCIERQRDEIARNTRQFLAGLPANNVLLWGSRGTGKSSLIKALLNEYSAEGLRLVEVDKQHLAELQDIVDCLGRRPEKFILYCDDLSFESGDASYKTLKSILDGSLAVTSGNVIIYATSNRRHLLPEFADENRRARVVDGELHADEATEEKISLSERFGLWLSFYPFSQDQYFEVVRHWLDVLGADQTEWDEAIRLEAIRWALQRGSRSGRVAWQFARDWHGRCELAKAEERRD
ncbi:ATP-binding protein [Methylogaea oryzae]|uniref:ATP-binding protein n=1 Tax=Methylogaea oryzae TaxID=1295382 RepID=UPI0020D12915|nr:ATP-binding protein [Methylogaea oryzae]